MITLEKVLYLFNDNTYISKQGDCLVLKIEELEKLRIPILEIEYIIIFGNVFISNHIVKLCSDNGIIISYIDMYGNFLGRFYGKNIGNIFLRKKQYDLYDNNLEFIRNVIIAKSINSSNLLRYYSRFDKDEKRAASLYDCYKKILDISQELKKAEDIDSIRGIEGSISSVYFSNFDNLLKINDDLMKFEKRSKNPPENNINSLLSLFYTLYTLNISAALESFGLDSQLGYMHKMRSGRASLACDMIEEFRAVIVDRFVIKIVNLNQVSSTSFEITGEGIKLKKDDLKKILKLWESYKEEEIFHPLLKKKIKIKILPYIQAQLLAKYIRGDIEGYPPFIYKLT